MKYPLLKPNLFHIEMLSHDSELKPAAEVLKSITETLFANSIKTGRKVRCYIRMEYEAQEKETGAVTKESLAAPSVAGTQPTPYKNGDAQKWFEDYCYEHHVNFAKRIETGGEDSKRLDELVPEILEAFLDQFFPQGTPQVEEASRKIVEYFVEQYGDLGVTLNRPDIDAVESILEHGVGAPAQPGPQTRFDDFDDAAHPCNIWWKEHGHLMMSGGGRREFIWACRGWFAREQLAEDVEVTGDSMHESKPSPAQGTPEPPKVEEIAKQIAMECYEHMHITPTQEIGIMKHAETSLGRYFPPASQTPPNPEDVPDLYRLAYMPGVWRCPKCEFVLSKATISMSSASIGTTPEDRQSEECPNDGEWMVPVTYKESLRACEKRLLQELESRATPASTARTDGWVSVEIKPTEPQIAAQRGWFHVANEVTKRQDIAKYLKGDFMGHALQFNEVTHWRELPAAPGSVPQAPKDECLYGPVGKHIFNPHDDEPRRCVNCGIPQAEPPKEEKP